jgi:hypothetical protein
MTKMNIAEWMVAPSGKKLHLPKCHYLKKSNGGSKAEDKHKSLEVCSSCLRKVGVSKAVEKKAEKVNAATTSIPPVASKAPQKPVVAVKTPVTLKQPVAVAAKVTRKVATIQKARAVKRAIKK